MRRGGQGGRKGVRRRRNGRRREGSRLEELQHGRGGDKMRRKKRATKPSMTNVTTTAVMTTRAQADQEQKNDNGSEDARTVFGAILALKTLFGDTGLWLYILYFDILFRVRQDVPAPCFIARRLRWVL